MKLEFFSDRYKKIKNQISCKSVQWQPSCSIRTDKHTWRSFRNFAKAPKMFISSQAVNCCGYMELVLNEWNMCIEKWWNDAVWAKSRYAEKPPLPVPLDPSQVTQGMAWHRTKFSAVWGKLTNRPPGHVTTESGLWKTGRGLEDNSRNKEGASTNHVMCEQNMEILCNKTN